MNKIIATCLFFTVLLSGCGNADNKFIIQKNIFSEGSNAYHVFSHRGASGEEEESTYASYDLAVWYGSKWIEMDLVTSKDGTLWVSHDVTAERMTGVEKKFSEMSDFEIRELRTFRGGEMRTIEDFLERYYGEDVGFNIAIRDTLWDTQWEDLSEILNEYYKKDSDFSKRLIIQAETSETLKKVKNYDDGIMTLFLANNLDTYDSIMADDEALQYVDIIAVDSFYVDKRRAGLVNEVHDKDKYYAVFTLNTTVDLIDVIQRGVDFYFTDFTAKALMLEERYR